MQELPKQTTSTSHHSTLDAAAASHAAQFLNEKVETLDEEIQKIQDWLATEPQLNARTDVKNVLRFLRGCKHDMNKSQRKLTNFYRIRSQIPEWFSNRDPLLPQLQKLLELGVFLPLRGRDSEHRLVVLIRTAVHDPRQHLQSDVFKIGKMILELELEADDSVAVFGVCAVFDLAGVTLGHAMQLPPAVVRKAVHAWQDCYPVRTRRLDFVNAPMYVNFVLNIFRRFMTEKLRKRVHVHSKPVGTVVSPDLLPVEYGGTAGTLQELIDYWKERTTESREWFLQDELHRANLGE